MTEMERRVAAVTATWTRFRGRPFAFGRVDCVKVGAWHLREMGHRTSGIGRAGTYRSALGAKRALARAGFASVAEALSRMGLQEIAPAAALPGDVVIGAGSDGHEALGIVAGNMMMLGFHEDMLASGLQRVRLSSLDAVRAWRA